MRLVVDANKVIEKLKDGYYIPKDFIIQHSLETNDKVMFKNKGSNYVGLLNTDEIVNQYYYKLDPIIPLK